MIETNEAWPRDNEGSGQLPPLGEAVWVHCDGYETIAYRDVKGVWRNLGNDREVKGITKVGLPYGPWDY